MAYEPKENTGSLFKNDRKQTDNHPDYTGTALIDGRSYWLSAWIKTGAKGKFMSLALKPREVEQRQSYADERPAPARRKPDSEAPF